MPENFTLFETEIKEIEAYSEIDHDDFTIICHEVRKIFGKFGNQISPSAVVDLIESAVSIYTIAEVQKEINSLNQLTPEVAVILAAKDLGLMTENVSLEDNLSFGSIKSNR